MTELCVVLLQSNNEEEEMSDTELMPEEEDEISGEEGIPRGINGIQSQVPPPPPAELLAKLKQQVSIHNYFDNQEGFIYFSCLAKLADRFV